MKTNAMLVLTLALALSGCSTNGRMLAPDPDPNGKLSPETPAARHHRHDPVCGAMIAFQEGPYTSCHRGVEYSFDCTECKTLFDENPGYYSCPDEASP